jgi:HTH-type transcriptional regulator / antitoxin HigA
LEKPVMKTKTAKHEKIPTTYTKLVAQCMPRPLHDEVDYRNALKALDAMAGFKLNGDQEDYFDAIATFVEKYEAEHHPLNDIKLNPIELLRSLMEEHELSPSDLGRLLGDRSVGHRILNGERELSKTHIRVLAEHFRLNPAALL